ncbi:MAG: Trk K+ transport system NAD-binding subunit [Candidatus Accumulibacter regalis]|uniref:potassium channel family protein n=1 Tax=Candidatus Accumulibacter TaxID=327159 RepID=UPI001A58F510|nr:NAD-binding protein [Accumulibacter sp.]MBL8425362.1 NAD-binding protein [Candidatus Accumulibacter phosphatis]
MIGHFKRSTRRLFALILSIPLVILAGGLLYMFLMTHLENSPRDFWTSVEWAAETLTTTGYGHDSHWTHPAMILFVIFFELVGMSFYVLIFPVFFLPYFEERFEQRLPGNLPEMNGRVLIHRYGPAVDSLVEELRRVGTAFVILEQDERQARRLRDRGYDVVFGSLDEQPGMLAGVETAQALITNADDHADATFIMMARERGFSGTILALAEEPLHRPAMEKIGATAVFTPSHVLGAALAARASSRISPKVEGLQLLGERIGIADFRVQAGSPLAGQRLGTLRMRARYGVTVIGQWHGGRFAPAEGPDTRVEAGAILVATGAYANLARVERLATPLRRYGPIVVAGYGAVGRKVVEMLRDAGETIIVIDDVSDPAVDVVGNVLEHATLDRAEVRKARAVVLALSNDSAGVFATAVVRDYAPDVRLIARVNLAPNVARLYQAGADFALSVGQVAGQILAHHLLGEDAVSVEQRLKLARVGPGALVGGHPWQVGIREKTATAVVAVERGTDVLVEFDQAFKVRADDVLFVCGTTASLEKYMREFGATPAERPVAPTT